MILKFYRRFKERKQRAFINETITAWEPYMADGVFGELRYEETLAMSEYFRRTDTLAND